MDIGILIADDEELVRTGFRMILEAQEDFNVVGAASDGSEAVELARSLQPDVILMDIRMPGMDGLEATRRIVSDDKTPDSKVLILTTFDRDEYVYEALRAGASGFLLKRTPAETLVEGIRVIANGDALLAPSVTKRLIDQFANNSVEPNKPGADALGTLSQRELEVLTLVAKGLSNSECAEQLFLSEGTVKTHVKRIYTKLDLRDRTQAVIFAYETGMVDPRRD
ncbi:MAG: response regulator transcription factor [Chloroflexi bacterium]|nr:response regulator transcription factor [Chloroflexota bacterium]